MVPQTYGTRTGATKQSNVRRPSNSATQVLASSRSDHRILFIDFHVVSADNSRLYLALGCHAGGCT